MNRLYESDTSSNHSVDFDLLRAQIESAIERPALLTVTSSTALDGRHFAAHELAVSFAAAGYATLFINVTPSPRVVLNAQTAVSFESLAEQVERANGIGALSTLTLSNARLIKTGSKRDIEVALATLRRKFDFIVMEIEYETSASFATSIYAASDGVLVSLKRGRRQVRADARLSNVLAELQTFLGVVVLDPTITNGDAWKSSVSDPSAAVDLKRREATEVIPVS